MAQRASVLVCLMATATWLLPGCESPNQPTESDPSPTVAKSQPENSARNRRVAGLLWSKPQVVASGNAYAGPWRMNDSDFDYVDDASVDVHPTGTDVVWVDNHNQQLTFQRFARSEALPEPESKPTVVSDSPETFSWLPRVETAGRESDRIYILWQEIVFSGGSHGGEAFFVRSNDGGRSFSDPVNLSKTTMGIGKGRLTEKIWHNGSLDLKTGHDGNIYAAWTAYQGPLEFRRSTDGGKTFAETIDIAPESARPARAPAIAVGPDGTVIVAWTVGERDQADLRLAVSTNAGQSFGPPTTILPSDGHSDAPKISVAGDKLHLTYAEAPDGMFEAYHVRYARTSLRDLVRRNEELNFDGSKRIATRAHFPSMATLEQTIYLLWNHYPAPDEPPRGLKFVASRDSGDSFTEPQFVPGTESEDLGINGSLQGMLMEKLDAHGPYLGVADSRFNPGKQSLIRLITANAENL